MKIQTEVQKIQKNRLATQKRPITCLKFFHDQNIPGISNINLQNQKLVSSRGKEAKQLHIHCHDFRQTT